MDIDNKNDDYFSSYEDMEVHQIMLQDEPRMRAYQAAIMNNKDYIKDKIVMDVGAGSGILSIFCAQAGAKKVYAVEASNLAQVCKKVVKDNNFENIIEVLFDKVEDVKLLDGEKVDIIVSEWMGFYLLHEGMLDSVFFARDNFLKPGGKLFPESATIYVSPCSVPVVYDNWNNHFGVNLNSMGEILRKCKSEKPEVMIVPEKDLLAEKTAFCWIDLKEDSLFELDSYNLKHVVGSNRSGKLQGFCIWFECTFPVLVDNMEPVVLNTSPSESPTHWKQTVIVLPEERDLEKGEPIAWEVEMKRSAENRRRYDLQLAILDPLNESHPTPCTCYMTKCIVIRTFLEQHPDGKEHFPSDEVME